MQSLPYINTSLARCTVAAAAAHRLSLSRSACPHLAGGPVSKFTINIIVIIFNSSAYKKSIMSNIIIKITLNAISHSHFSPFLVVFCLAVRGRPQWVPPERSFFLLYPGRAVGRTARVLLGGFGGSDSAQRHTMYEVCLYVTRY